MLCSLRRGRPGVLATLVALAGCDRGPSTSALPSAALPSVALASAAPSALPSAVLAAPLASTGLLPATSARPMSSARPTAFARPTSSSASAVPALSASESTTAPALASAASSASEPGPEPPEASVGCREQAPQPFLIRGNYRPSNGRPGDNARSIRYRARAYGDVPGLTTGLAALPAELGMHTVSVFGQPVRLHRKITPALRCVEREILRTCKDAYHVGSLAGWRDHNTFHQGEISNHMFGIALDIDPGKNPCCHCIEPWNTDARCANRRASPYEHASLPRCWIDTFERFGFYWLGHDTLEDTMHFEFLGDPDKIVSAPETPR